MCGFQGTQKPYTISGDNGERDPPVPIPNTEVKPFSADGTWLETTWESRTLPDSMKKGLTPLRGGFFFHSICNVLTLWSSSMNVRQMKADCFTKRNSMDIIAIGSFASEVEIVLLHTLWVKRDAGRGTPA